MAARDTVATVPSVYQRPAKLQGKLPRWWAEVEVIRPATAGGVDRLWRWVGCDTVAGVAALSRKRLGAKPRAGRGWGIWRVRVGCWSQLVLGAGIVLLIVMTRTWCSQIFVRSGKCPEMSLTRAREFVKPCSCRRGLSSCHAVLERRNTKASRIRLVRVLLLVLSGRGRVPRSTRLVVNWSCEPRVSVFDPPSCVALSLRNVIATFP